MDYKKFYNNSVKFLVDYARKNKLRSYILGISGGIDSTVVAAIASEACKLLNIPLIGRSLPSSSNEMQEKDAADLVGKAFCTNYKVININNKVSSIKEMLNTFEGEMSRLQYGNIKARFRMMYLYHLASYYKGCVLDTDNKTEHELGFWTIHGDVGDVNCGLVHLWKSEVYELANFIAINILKEDTRDTKTALQYQALIQSISLTPTDGNGVSSSDCAQFYLNDYGQVDDILKTMYFPDNKSNKDKDAEYRRLTNDYDEQGVDKVMMFHQNSEYKRKKSPMYPDKWSVIYEQSNN